VFDTVVFVRSLLNPRSRWGRLVFEYHDSYRLVVSTPVVGEMLDVLHRSGLQNKFSVLAGRDINWVLERIGRAEIVEIEEIPSVSRDRNDDKFLATALAAQADYIVSEDRDLLDLRGYQGIQIVDTETFLGILDQENAQ